MHLQKFGKILTEHVGNADVEKSENNYTESQIHDRDMNWLSESDIVIAEVSTPSLGVGYEIGRAVEAGKPVLCLYHIKADFELSAMISGCRNVKVFRYNDLDDACGEIEEFIMGVKD